MKKYYYDKDGYQNLLEQMDNLKKNHQKNSYNMSKSFQDAVGDGAHDNHEFEALLMEEKLIISRMKNLQEKLDNAVILENKYVHSKVNIGDSVRLLIKYSKEDHEEITVTLIGGDGDIEKNYISLNSPIGEAIFGKKINTTQTMTLNDRDVNIDILEKLTNEKTIER